MKKLLPILSLFIVLIACNKNNEIISLEGRYAGTFSRTGMDTVVVEINFAGNAFEGQSTQSKYPAICHGSFELDKSKVIFNDSCVWTADFDWTLILSGEFSILFEDERNIKIWRENAGIKDEYLLVKLIR